MWRDLNQVYPDGTRYLGSPRVGEVASAIPATGDHGPALAYPNVVANGWTTQRVLFWARSWDLSTLWVDDNSAWIGTVAADGTYHVTGDIYVDDVLQSPQATVSLYVGVPGVVVITPASTSTASVAGVPAIVISGGAVGSITVTPAPTTTASVASVPAIAITTPPPWRPSAPVGAHRRAQLATRRARLSTRTR